MTPAQEALAAAYADGVQDGRDAAARESAAEIEGLRADLAKAQEATDEVVSEETWPLNERIGELAKEVQDAQEQLARWDDVARELRHLLARNQTIQFLPSPGPARLTLGYFGLQGLGMDGLLLALAAVAEECKPCPK